jgi:hypothetical protein
MFVVAAAEQRPGPPPPTVAGRPRWHDGTTEPVGVQHAAPSRLDGGATRVARCGADLTGWIIFGRRPFDVGAASCRRCAQLLSTAEHSPVNREAPAASATATSNIAEANA